MNTLREKKDRKIKSGIAKQIRWRSGGSMAAAAALLVSGPQMAQAQSLLRAPDMMVENIPHGRNISIPRPEMVQNQPHARTPDFRARDGRITAPMAPLPINDIRISAPLTRLPHADIRISAPFEPLPIHDIRISAPLNNLPVNDVRISAPSPAMPIDFNPRDVRISSPVAPLPVQDIRISSPVTLPGAYQLQAGPTASGHAVNGNPVFTSGAGTFSPGATTSSISGLGGETVINWGLVDESGAGAISFLPEGNILSFSGGGNFTVLNRILPTDQTRAIRFDGTVESLVGGISGGNIWFYSPGGIIASATSRFDVGSLVLSTNDISTADGLFGPSGEIRFSGVAGSASAIEIQAGAQINALNNGSYVAMVAPRIVQDGTVDVNGSVAYVAAEQAELTINNGLFDIAVTVGTDDTNGIVHSGTTTGDAATPVADDPLTTFVNEANRDAQAIYMMAVPKNAALTMLVGGSAGYRAATGATIINGNIVLTTGANVSVGGPRNSATIDIDKTVAAGPAGSLTVGGGAFGLVG